MKNLRKGDQIIIGFWLPDRIILNLSEPKIEVLRYLCINHMTAFNQKRFHVIYVCIYVYSKYVLCLHMFLWYAGNLNVASYF